jgi:hypothetical protein
MAQDLRNLLKNDIENKSVKMSEGHEAQFLEKLDKALPKTQKLSYRYRYLNIAAGVVMLLGLGFGVSKYFQSTGDVTPSIIVADEQNDSKTLGDVSPDLKKVEDYYLASINLELSKVKLTPNNKELVDGYIERLKALNDEYDTLILELNTNGPNEETLDALIDNLKLRLNLVMRLKSKLQEFNDDLFSPVQA